MRRRQAAGRQGGTGARSAEHITLLQRLASWFKNHGDNMVGSLGDMLQHPGSSFLTVAVIGVTLALPAGLHVLVENGRSVAAGWESAARISVFLDTTASVEAARTMAADLRRRPEYAEVNVIDPDDALAEFRDQSGFGSALDVLDDNPLPPVLVLTPSLGEQTPDRTAMLAAELTTLPEVDEVVVDTEWIARLQAIVAITERAVRLISLLLAAAVVIIVGNTIRLDIQNRRDEIEVVKLIGASDAFIRRPFLYSGLWYGTSGGILAWLLVSMTLLFVEAPVRRLAGLYGSDFGLAGLGLAGVLSVLLAGSALGWVGSWLAVSRHLREIEPR